MKTSIFSEKQRLAILAEQDQGKKVEEICQKHQISPATFYKWKAYFQEQADEGKRRLRELEAENKRLKKMYAELSIDHEILQEGSNSQKSYPPSRPRKTHESLS